MKINQKGSTLDEWTEAFAPRLKENLDVTVYEMTDLNQEGRDSLVRILMIMVRDWRQGERS